MTRLGLTLVVAGAVGCTGDILAGRGGPEVSPAPPPEAVTLPPVIQELPRCEPTGVDAPLRSLTWREYGLAVQAGLGIDVSAELPASTRSTGDFDFDLETQEFGARRVNSTVALSRLVADTTLAPARRMTAVGCDPASMGCAERFLDRVSPSFYRRALTATERTELLDLFRGETDPWEGVRLMLRGLLVSPSFLMKAAPGVARTATGTELAERLSFMFWGAGPDAELLTAAARGELATGAGRLTHARRLSADPRARAHLRLFFEQWFGLDAVPALVRMDPQWTPQLAAAARAEAVDAFDRAIAPGTNFLTLYTNSTRTLLPPVAALYGVQPGVAELSQVPHRSGLFTTAAFLAASTGQRDVTSIVKRGRRIREMALCQTIPNPPPEVEQSTSADHQQPSCAGCHRTLDPIGEGLERYDALGRTRPALLNGAPLPGKGLFVEALDSEFHDGVELGRLMSERLESRACVGERVYRWAFGLPRAAMASCAQQKFTTTLAEHGFDVMAALMATVEAETFAQVPVEAAP
jgi:hypothetical protein